MDQNGHRSGVSSPMQCASNSPGSREPETVKTRACANCARLKMKCRWHVSVAANYQQTSCVRCARMKIPCHVPEPSRRRKRGKSTRVAQLEQKIDGLVSMIAAQQHVSPNHSPPLTPESQDQNHPGSGQTVAQHQTRKQQLQQDPQNVFRRYPQGANECQPTHQLRRSAPNESSPYFHLMPGFSFTRDEAASYIEIYQREFMPKYPFVVIPAGIDPDTLYSESPSLFWMVIGAVAPQSTRIQHELCLWFRRYIAEHIVVHQRKSLQLLQAILLHLAWGDFHFYVNTEATTAIQLATSLLLDLKLDRAPESNNLNPKSLLGEAWATLTKGMPKPRERSLDEKRAVLGLYRITSIISALFRRGSQLPWNNYLAQCCDSLAESELESDMFLVAAIRIQRVAEQAFYMLPGYDILENVTGTYRAPIDMVVNNARRELELIADAQPDYVKKQHIFWATYHVLLMRLSEPAISMQSPSLAEIGILPSEPFHRFETVWKCLIAAGDFFNAMLSIPASELPTHPVSITGLLAFAIVTTSRLLLLDATIDWQPALARKQIDFADLLKRLADLYEDADNFAKEAGRRRRLLDGGGTVFCRYSFKLRWIRQWYLSKLPADQLTVVDPQQGPVDVVQDFDTIWQDVDFDDNFWTDFMSMYDPDLFAAPVTETMNI